MEPVSLSLLFAAFIAGFLMFLAPCTLPLVPAFLAYLSGSVHTANTQSRRWRLLRYTLAYCAGFSTVFITLGVLAGALGGLLTTHQTFLMQLGGVFVLLVGLSLTGVYARLGIAGTRTRAFPVPQRTSPGIAFGIGVAFALGWTPCIGPVLATILLYASSTATALTGATLLAVFSVGLTIPFVLVALLYEQLAQPLERSARTAAAITQFSGWLLVVLGLLLLTNSLRFIYDAGYWLFALFGLDVLYQYF